MEEFLRTVSPFELDGQRCRLVDLSADVAVVSVLDGKGKEVERRRYAPSELEKLLRPAAEPAE
jgi:hypothetical protein